MSMGSSEAHELLEGSPIDPVIVDKDIDRKMETDNLLSGVPDSHLMPNVYSGGARSTSNLRDIDSTVREGYIHERLPSVGSLNPYNSYGAQQTQIYNMMLAHGKFNGSATKTTAATTTVATTTAAQQKEEETDVKLEVSGKESAECENPLFTLANSVTTEQDKSDVDIDTEKQRASSITSEWLNNSGSTNGAQLNNLLNNQLAMQILAQSITQETSSSGKPNGGASAAGELVLQMDPHGSSPDLLHKKQVASGSRLFICDFPQCGKTFSRKMNLMSHYQSAHEHKKPFLCEKCGKAFSRHSDRRRHEKSQHSDNTTYVCGGQLDSGSSWGCGKVFKRKDGLTAHWKSGKARKKCFSGLNEEGHRRLESDLVKS